MNMKHKHSGKNETTARISTSTPAASPATGGPAGRGCALLYQAGEGQIQKAPGPQVNCKEAQREGQGAPTSLDAVDTRSAVVSSSCLETARTSSPITTMTAPSGPPCSRTAPVHQAQAGAKDVGAVPCPSSSCRGTNIPTTVPPPLAQEKLHQGGEKRKTKSDPVVARRGHVDVIARHLPGPMRDDFARMLLQVFPHLCRVVIAKGNRKKPKVISAFDEAKEILDQCSLGRENVDGPATQKCNENGVVEKSFPKVEAAVDHQLGQNKNYIDATGSKERKMKKLETTRSKKNQQQNTLHLLKSAPTVDDKHHGAAPPASSARVDTRAGAAEEKKTQHADAAAGGGRGRRAPRGPSTASTTCSRTTSCSAEVPASDTTSTCLASTTGTTACNNNKVKTSSCSCDPR
ncbi:unnamed protein product, partial [Amoebophrya sp. A120]|eukprot:GSA120T00017843001.1